MAEETTTVTIVLEPWTLCLRTYRSMYKGKRGNTFIPLPKELHRVAMGGLPCKCGYCEGTPMWDTLAVPDDGSETYTVHFPLLHRHAENPMKYELPKGIIRRER